MLYQDQGGKLSCCPGAHLKLSERDLDQEWTSQIWLAGPED